MRVDVLLFPILSQTSQFGALGPNRRNESPTVQIGGDALAAYGQVRSLSVIRIESGVSRDRRFWACVEAAGPVVCGVPVYWLCGCGGGLGEQLVGVVEGWFGAEGGENFACRPERLAGVGGLAKGEPAPAVPEQRLGVFPDPD
jgi:hypothetical protein